jgi:hypothetical protein
MPADDRLARFRAAIDDRLSALNDDYRTHRAGDFGMQAPTVQAVPAGFFATWMKRRGKLGGQHKVPRVINDDALFRDLRDCADRT